MIQDELKYIDLIDSSMQYDDAIKVLKEKGVLQITCTKVIMLVYGLRLREADIIVQNSIHWLDHKNGNEELKNNWFK